MIAAVGGSRGRAGIRIHRAQLGAGEKTRRSGIPITTPARTLLDLATELPLRQLEQALAEAQARRLVSKSALLHLLNRHRGRPGTAALRGLAEGSAPALTRSEAEERLLTLIRRAGLPEPKVNARLGPYEVDFRWREQRLVVEIDGFAFTPLGPRSSAIEPATRNCRRAVGAWCVSPGASW